MQLADASSVRVERKYLADGCHENDPPSGYLTSIPIWHGLAGNSLSGIQRDIGSGVHHVFMAINLLDDQFGEVFYILGL